MGVNFTRNKNRDNNSSLFLFIIYNYNQSQFQWGHELYANTIGSFLIPINFSIGQLPFGFFSLISSYSSTKGIGEGDTFSIITGIYKVSDRDRLCIRSRGYGDVDWVLITK